MNLQFITSVSKGYWNSVGKHCISSWNLPGEVVVYIDQQEGDLTWLEEIPYRKRLLHVPELDIANDYDVKTKIRKFWGKTCAQLDAVKNRGENTRIIWLDADIEQIESSKLSEKLFNFTFKDGVAMMRSNTHNADRYETGLVIFNQQHDKLDLFMRQYESFWNTEEELSSLFRPYDAMVLGAIGERRGFYNLCQNTCENKDAMTHTKYRKVLKHWINKKNKSILKESKEKNVENN